MKSIRSILLFTLFAAASSAIAQVPQRFNYQAVARDASGNALSEKTIGLRISIVDGSAGGPSLYTETFSAPTNKQGLFSIQVGGGSPTSGTFGGVVWTSGAKFLKVELDPAGGTAFTLLGTSQLLSVPYALAADKLSSPMSIRDLSDVSDTSPSVDQVLKWNGTEWVPGTGAGAIVTTAALGGDGSAANPLTIAKQNATSGQVLQWNGTDWKPATISGGVGDNWGTQSVVTNATLSGAGTSASPLTIATQSASNGQVLKYNGTTWAPAFDLGDNWGTAKVNTSTQFTGDGTPVSPLVLAQQGATTGQFLKWSGTGWIPGDGGGSLTLPASGNISDPAFALQIQNTNGTGIVGIQAGNTDATFGVEGRVLNTNTKPSAAGVMGHHYSTGAFGYGVFGLHDGDGVGVAAEAKGPTGYGMLGRANGVNGAGVYGLATGTNGRGVSGNAGGATGIGVYGGAVGPTAYAGYFDGQTLLRHNSVASSPNLYIWEDDINDKTRVRFNNGVANRYWDMTARTTSSASPDLDRYVVNHFSGGDILTITGDKKVGINISNPEHELEINGSMKLSGGIKLNSTFGTVGQVIVNTGGSAVWGSGTNALFSNTILSDQNADLNNISTSITSLTGLPGLTSIPTFTTTTPTKVIFTFSHSQLVSTNTGDVDLQIEIGFMQGATIINRAIVKDVILNNKTKSISYTHHCQFNSAGTYRPYIYIGTGNSGKFNAVGTGSSTGQVSIQVIAQ